MKRILLISFVLMSALISEAFAQRTVSGKVSDATSGEGIPGVNIRIEGTSQGVISDFEGNYRLEVPTNEAVLVFTAIGYLRQQLPVGSRSVINVNLEEDVKQLEEVVVVGYGTSLKKELTGSISTVGSEEIENLPVASPDQALQGLASGVFVNSNSGTPGGGISVRVRGQTSINASNDPLYIVDGVIVTSGSLTQSGFGGQDQNALAGLNPQDIESIQVLKDAASTAIYGARAANGVVLITTKRGKSGKAKFNFDAFTGFGEPTRTIRKLNAADWVMIKREAHQNDNPGADPLTNEELDWDGETDTDWIDEVFQTSQIQQYNASVSGGGERMNFYLSGGYRDETGVMIGSGFERLTGRLNLDYNATDKLKIGTSIGISSDLVQRIQNDNNIYGVYSAAILTPPTKPVRDPETGEYVDALPAFRSNAVRSALEPRYDNTTNRLISNFYTNYSIVSGLDFRTDFSYDYVYLREDHYDPATTSRGRRSNGRGNYNTKEVGRFIVEPTLRYTKTFNDVHKVTTVGGASYQQDQTFSNFVVGTGFSRPSLTYITSAANITNGSSYREDYSFASVFGRLNYSFDEKYLASVSVRRDGSSRFGPNMKFGTFYAVSAGWNFVEEAFLQDVDWLSFGKLRVSYGVLGNDRIGEFRYLGTWSGGENYLDQPALEPERIANPNLQWEETATFDAGIELAMFNNRLSVNLGYFNMDTDNLLFANPIPWTTGFSSFQDNIGRIRNEGVELDVTTVNIDRGGFSWKTSLNVSKQRNEVVEIVSEEPILRGFASAIIKGEPLNTFYGYKWLGVDPATGESQFFDANDDGQINSEDRIILGDHAPDYVGGFTNTFSYKGISLDAFFQFVEGVDVYNNNMAFGMNPSAPWGMDIRMLDRWQKPGDITYIPKPTTGSSLEFSEDNSRFLSDGSYLRLKNITLAYNLPASLLNRINIGSMRIYAAGTNLLTFTNYQGADPEVSVFGGTSTAQGTDFLTFPQAKLYTIGIKVGL